MKSLYVTERSAIGDDRFHELLSLLSGAPGLSVQLREKNGPDVGTLFWTGLALQRLGGGVPLYVNRRFDIALASGAAGVHLPSDGLPIGRVRAETPRGFRIGVSTHSPSEAVAAIEQRADLVLIGPIFDTPSKAAYGPPLTPAALGALPLREEHETEIFGIGGIEEDRLGELEPFRDRISGVAGIRIFQEAPDPAALVERLAAR